jgi:hypothetical protein
VRTWPWIALVVVTVVWELLALDTGTGAPHLTISALAQAFRAFNAAVLAGWIVIGLCYGFSRAGLEGEVGDGGDQVGPAVSVSIVVGGSPRLPHGALLANVLPAVRNVGVGFWIAVGAVAGVIDLVGRVSGVTADAGELLRLVARPRFARVGLIIAWGYAGWHLFAR